MTPAAPFSLPKSTEMTSRVRFGGVTYRFTFPNNRGASVISHQYSYGGLQGLWELAVTGADGHLDYSTPVTNDVIGWLSVGQVGDLLAQIAALPAPKDAA